MKKLSLLLASIGAGLLLVGGTVAAYVVTSADFLGARVSPGNLQEDADGHITLNWAEKSVANVSGLEVGTPQTVATVTLGAESDDVEESALNDFTGYFSVTIENMSNPTSGPNLLNFLSVETYKATAKDTFNYESADLTGAGHLSAKKGDQYRTRVELLDRYQDTDTASVFDIISQQIVYVSFSWGPDSSSADVTNVRTVYFAKPASYAGKVYFYAYKGTTVNRGFPGIEMTKVYQTKVNEDTFNVYAVEFDATKYTNYNFNNGVHDGEVVFNWGSETADEIKTALATNPYYKNTSGTNYTWAAKPDKLLAPFYVRGKIGDINYWDAYADNLAMTLSSGTEYELKGLELHAGDEIKVYKTSGADAGWCGPEKNWIIERDGLYNIYADMSHGDGYGWNNHMVAIDVSYTAYVGSATTGTVLPFNFTSTSECDAEFSGRLTPTLGQVLSIKKYSSNTPITYTVDAGDGNQLNNDFTFKTNSEVDIYLKLNGSNYSVYAALVS